VVWAANLPAPFRDRPGLVGTNRNKKRWLADVGSCKQMHLRTHQDKEAGVSGCWEKNFPPAVSGILWLSVAGAMGVLLASAFRGLEGTDESSWVLCAANPWASPGWGIHFGFFLHPFWQISGHVGAFRVVTLLALALMGYGFSKLLILAEFRLGAEGRMSRYSWILIPSLWCAVLSRYSIGTRTPSYDWGLLFGALLFVSGWLWMGSAKAELSIVAPSALCSLGVVVCFINKWVVFPGYLLLVGVLVGVCFPPRDRKRIGLGLGIWGLVWFCLFLFYATPGGFRDTVWAGMAQLKVGSHANLLTHYGVGFLKGCWQVIRAYPWAAGLFGLVWGLLYFFGGKKKPDKTNVAGLTFLAALILLLGRGHWQGGLTSFSKGMMMVVVWLTGVFLMARPFWKSRGHSRWEDKYFWATTAMLCVVPWLNGVGTATGITDYLVHGTVFFVATGWVFLGRALAGGLPPWCMAAAALMLGVIHSARAITSTWNTYRIGSVWTEMVPLNHGPEKGRLLSFRASGGDLGELSRDMEQMGFQVGDPILGITDLCDLVYLLGGVSPGVAWYMGHWLPENDGVKSQLGNVPADVLKRSWVLLKKNAKEWEKIEHVWPMNTAVPLPRKVEKTYYWPWGDGAGVPEEIYLYRPASPNK